MSFNFAKRLFILFTVSALFINCNSAKKTMGPTISRDSIAVSNPPLQETHWTLVELMGKQIPDSATNKEMYIELKKEQSRVEGNGGCNTIAGTYTLSKKDKVLFSQMISTRMMCPGIKYEDAFLRSLSSTDHYYLKADTLFLTHGKLLTLAKLVAKK